MKAIFFPRVALFLTILSCVTFLTNFDSFAASKKSGASQRSRSAPKVKACARIHTESLSLARRPVEIAQRLEDWLESKARQVVASADLQNTLKQIEAAPKETRVFSLQALVLKVTEQILMEAFERYPENPVSEEAFLRMSLSTLIILLIQESLQGVKVQPSPAVNEERQATLAEQVELTDHLAIEARLLRADILTFLDYVSENPQILFHSSSELQVRITQHLKELQRKPEGYGLERYFAVQQSLANFLLSRDTPREAEGSPAKPSFLNLQRFVDSTYFRALAPSYLGLLNEIAYRGDLDAAKFLLEKGVDFTVGSQGPVPYQNEQLSLKDFDLSWPLSWALASGQNEFVEWLIAHNLTYVTESGSATLGLDYPQSPVNLAIALDQFSIFEILLEKERILLSSLMVSPAGKSLSLMPAHVAAALGLESILFNLVRSWPGFLRTPQSILRGLHEFFPAEYRAKYDAGQINLSSPRSALEILIAHGHDELFKKTLLEFPELNRPEYLQKSLGRAIEFQRYDLLRWMLQNQISIDIEDTLLDLDLKVARDRAWWLLALAYKWDDVEALKVIFEEIGSDISKGKDFLAQLRWAIARGQSSSEKHKISPLRYMFENELTSAESKSFRAELLAYLEVTEADLQEAKERGKSPDPIQMTMELSARLMQFWNPFFHRSRP